MFALFLNRKPGVRVSAARGWLHWAAAVLIVLTFAQPASAGPLPLQAGRALPPRQLEPMDQAYVTPPEVTFRWEPTEGAEWYYLRIYREDRMSNTIRIDVGSDRTSETVEWLEPGYTYEWIVYTDVETFGSDSDRFSFTLSEQPVVPRPPEGITASDGAYDDKVMISLDDTFRAAYYLLQRRAPGSDAYVDWARVGDQREFRDNEVEVGQRYEYRARACNSAGCSDPSPVDEGWVGECKPLGRPQLISPPDGDEVQFTAQDPNYWLEWEPVPEAADHRVRVWDIHTGNTVAEETAGDKVELWGVEGDLAWNVTAIHSVEGCPNGPPSETWTYHAEQKPPPPIPVNVQATDGKYTDRVVVTWEQPESDHVLEQWEIFRATKPDPQLAEEVHVQTADYEPYVDTDVTSGMVYYYWISACSHSDGCSEKSPAESGFAGESDDECSALDAPQLVSPPDGAEVRYTAQDPYYWLEWEPVEGAGDHWVRVWDVHTGNTVVSETAGDKIELWAVDGDLAWNVTAIHSVEGCPNGPPSETWTYHAMRNPPPAVPVNVQATDGAYADRVVVTWEQPESESEVEGWQIWRSTESGVSTAVVVYSLSGHPYVDHDVTAGTIYYYWIEACSHDDPCSEKSEPDSGFAGESAQVLDHEIYMPVMGR